jgi:hypothetical protein
LSAGPFVTGGVELTSGTVRAQMPPFASPGTSTSAGIPPALLLGGGVLGRLHLLEAVAIVARIGVVGRPLRSTIELPMKFAPTPQPLDPGTFGVLALIGAELRIF